MAKRKMGTGAPDPTKDRSAHEAARGRKKLSLTDLSRQLPSEDDLAHYFDRIKAESDRGSAVMAGALVERALEDQIRSKLHDPGDGTADTWFSGANAPFRTFSSKIALGRALGIYNSDVEVLLIAVKNVRNAFAHCMAPLDFTNSALEAETKKLIPSNATGEWKLAARHTFAFGCLTLARILGMKAVAQALLGEYVPPGSEGRDQYVARAFGGDGKGGVK